MPLRSRASSPAASARVVALLGRPEERVAPAGGWVPDQPAFRAELPPTAAVGPPVAPTDPPEPLLVVRGTEPAAPAVGGSHPSVRQLLTSGRLDPGRRGVAALVCVGLVAAVLAGFVLLRGRPVEQPMTVPPVLGAVGTSAGPELVVDVAGKVRRPGLVRLPPGARVDDALKAAGGVLPGASTGLLNLARKLADGEQVLVGVEGAPVAGQPGGLLDLNTATVQDLDGLPGIGPVLADRIVSWRTEHGRFASVDQLREVSGIGESKYQSLKSKVRV